MPIPQPLNPVVSVNFHVNRFCDSKCRFCYATFLDVPGQLSPDDGARLIHRLREAGCQKITFAGGEPTLHRHIGLFLAEARAVGLTTGLVTNGSRLRPLIESQAGDLDWIGLSVDSQDEGVQAALGRGRGDHVRKSIALFDLARRCGIRCKLNTVVTSANWDQDMSALIRRVRPDRWKVFQVLAIGGQNDGSVDSLLISLERFRTFVARHAPLAAEGLGPVAEDNDAILGAYAMIDPLGRFFGDATGRHVYSEPILAAGVLTALGQVGFDIVKLAARGGLYDWGRTPAADGGAQP